MHSPLAREPVKNLPKYRQIVESLRSLIVSGKFGQGGRLPSENELGRQFHVSRLTVQRAFKELQLQGLVERRVGSGTFVTPRADKTGYLFGLLIPGLGETEIFEPICQGMAKAGGAGGHALLWGDNTHSKENRDALTRQLCSDYISRRVSGVFFAPHEGTPDKDSANLDLVNMLDDAGIPVVLLDHCVERYPNRCRFDVVGIDNRRAGFRMTHHLLTKGARRLIFWGHRYAAPTVQSRSDGFIDAHRSLGIPAGTVVLGDASDEAFVRRTFETESPDGFVCCNDRTAATLMRSLDSLGIDVPGAVRIVGIDDVRYANLLRVPLTTLRQPCLDMGAIAIDVMLSRIASPQLPARDIVLACEMVVRTSCGPSLCK